MKVKANDAVFNIDFDPSGEYTNFFKSEARIMDAMGLIPYFIAEAATTNFRTTKEVMAVMDECYGFGFDYDMIENGSSVTEDGVWTSEEDPDIAPYAKFTFDNIVVYVYPYGVVAVTDGETTVMKRFD